MSTPYQFTQTSLFSPTQISGCSVWLDAADRSSISLSGSNVSQWNDKSGNGMTVSAASAQPVYLSNAQNRLGALNFDGTKNLGTTSVPASKFVGNTNNLSIFVVYSLSNVGSGYASPFCWANAGAYPRIGFTIGNNADGVMMDVGTGATGRTSHSVPPPTFDNTFYFTSYWKNGANTQMNLNGSNKASSSTQDTTGFAASSYSFNVGNGYSNSVFFMRGSIGEILFYNNTLSTANFQQVEGYLAWKWGLQGSLPTTHPYKTTPVYANPPFPLIPRVPTFTSVTIYNPTSIPNCVLWLDASDRTTLFTDSAGTIPVTDSGQTVAFWRDKSASGNSATGVANQPTVLFSGTNNLPVVNFNGSQFLSLTGNLLPNGSTPFTYFFLVRTTSSSVQVYYTHGNASLGETVQFYYANYLLVNDLYGSSGPSDNTPYNSVYVLMDSTASSTVYSAYDNGNPFTTNNVAISLNTGSTFAYIGCGQIGGTRTYFLIGQIAEVIAYNRVLSTSERQQVEAYIQWKWGLQSTIPSTNPYTIAPPYQAPSFPLVPRVPAFINKVFNPTSIAGCSLWLDAADSSTVTLSGNTVIGLRDKSPVNITLSNASGFTYPNNTFNGSRPSFFVNGGGNSGGGTQRLGVNSTYALATPFTVSFVCQHVGGANYGYILDSASGSGRPYIVDGGLGTTFQTPFNPSGGGLTTTSPLLNSFVFGPSSVAFQNGTQQFTGNAGTFTTGGITVGNRFTLNESWPGHICEIIIHNTALTIFQRQQVEGYLAWKWGLQSSLPNNHPYKLFPPSP